MLATFALIGLLTASPAATAEDSTRPDVVIADFEGDDYGGWKADGQAFGDRPARGTLPGQMEVSGFLGRGLANSFTGGDDANGTLTSPAFRIDRPFINFLIGGGGFDGETCVNLIVDGQTVRTAAGKNREAGGTEALRWNGWDVRDLAGKQATIRIVDRRKGGWGHVNVDQIVQSDASRKPAEAVRSIVLNHRYLHLPVRTGGTKTRLKFTVDGQTIREFDIELVEREPDFLAFSDLEAYKGRTVKIHADELTAPKALEAIEQADDVPDAAGMYNEKHRPQFHFTSRRGWLNDPNGLVFNQGVFHQFYQHNPFGWNWGNMHWGHATSPDLVHWTEQPIALYPHAYGDWAFSGSAVVDAKNTSGFQNGAEPPLVAAYTSTGRGECIVVSNDRGRTWTEFDRNPVVKHNGRDPRLLWHQSSNQWVMAVYDEAEKRQSIDFYTSPDLKTWTFASRIDGFFECPDIFELPIDGDPNKTLWVLYAADAKYKLGRFDGKTFHVESGADKLQLWHGNFYAAQTFSNEPKGRRIQIGWGQGITFPGMPFNQQMALPVELTLRTTSDGVRMFAEPVAELQSLRVEKRDFSNTTLEPGKNPLSGLSGDLFEIKLAVKPGAAEAIELNLRGTPVVYDVHKQELVCKQVRAHLPLVDGELRLHVFLDKGSIEAFGADGRVAVSVGVIPDDANHALGLASRGGAAELKTLEVHPLRSAWIKP
jgi:fructan beta-fructosidase